jgi:O-antigen/teichoic acid export membrane protein
VSKVYPPNGAADFELCAFGFLIYERRALSNGIRGALNLPRLIFRNKTASQTALLFGAQVLNVLFGVLVNGANTRLLSVEEFGIFSFVTATILFVALFFDFGVFTSGSRLVALAKQRQDERECVGGLFSITMVIGVGLSGVLFLVSFLIDGLFATKIGYLLLMLSPLVAVFPFQTLLMFIFRGNNQIGKLALYTFLPRAVYFVAVLLAWRFFGFSLIISLYLYVLTLVVATAVIMAALKPSFRHMRNQIRLILRETREYGLNVYAGAIVDVFTRGTDKLLISYFIGAIPVGYYSIASMLASPISMVSTSLATSIFKDLTDKEKIPREYKVANLAILLLSGVGLIVLSPYIVTFVFTDKYLAALSVIPILTLSGVFNGMSQLYNAYFAAHRLGAYLRNTSILTSSFNLVGNFILISKIGMMGAAVSSLLTFFLTYTINIFYYRKALRLAGSR